MYVYVDRMWLLFTAVIESITTAMKGQYCDGIKWYVKEESSTNNMCIIHT